MTRGLTAIEGFKKKEDMVIRGKNTDASTVGITGRMGRIQVTGPRNTASAISLGTLLLKNPDLELKKGNGLGRVPLARLPFQHPHPRHPMISRTMNRSRSHYA